MATAIYDITAKAGKYIAGIRLEPDQATIELTPEQAAYELAQGTITPTGEPGSAPPDPAPVLATDKVEMLRGNLNLATRPTSAQLASFVQEQARKINAYTADVTLAAADKGALVVVTSASAEVVTLPNDWVSGESVTVRRGGAGAVTWALEAGATIVLSTARAGHLGIAEQHEEATFTVLSNAGEAAVWAVSGATS